MINFQDAFSDKKWYTLLGVGSWNLFMQADTAFRFILACSKLLLGSEGFIFIVLGEKMTSCD